MKRDASDRLSIITESAEKAGTPDNLMAMKFLYLEITNISPLLRSVVLIPGQMSEYFPEMVLKKT
jgi:hypothetical protein